MTAAPELPAAAFTLYLLHFEPQVGRCRHYLGLTRTPRLARRLAEHMAGRGARLTTRAIEAGAAVSLVRLWTADDPQEEQRLKRRGHFRRHCPLCGGAPAAAPDLPRVLHPTYSPPDPNAWQGLGWGAAP